MSKIEKIEITIDDETMTFDANDVMTIANIAKMNDDDAKSYRSKIRRNMNDVVHMFVDDEYKIAMRDYHEFMRFVKRDKRNARKISRIRDARIARENATNDDAS